MINPGTPTFNLSRVDEIRVKLQEKQDELLYLTRTKKFDDPAKVTAIVLEMRELNDELRNLLHVRIKPLENRALEAGQVYYVRVVRGQEDLYFSALNQNGVVEKINHIIIDMRETPIFIPVE